MSGHDNLLFITFISKIIVLSTETIVTLILSEIRTHEAQIQSENFHCFTKLCGVSLFNVFTPFAFLGQVHLNTFL